MPPVPLPDYQYYSDNFDEVAAEDIFVYGSDDQADLGGIDEGGLETSRNERLRRVHTYALRYLAGDRVYIHCARLRGPFINNPWNKETKTTRRSRWNGKRQQDTVTMGKPESKRRRLMEEDEGGVVATPAQKTRGISTTGGTATTRPSARKRQARRKVVYEEEIETLKEAGEGHGDDKGDELVDEGFDTLPFSKEQHTTSGSTSREMKSKVTVNAGSMNLRTTTKGTKSRVKPEGRNRVPKTGSRLGASPKRGSTTASKKFDTALHGVNDSGNSRVLRGESRGATSKLPASTHQDNHRQEVEEAKRDLLNPIVDGEVFPREKINIPTDLPLVDVAPMMVSSLVSPTVNEAEEIARLISGEIVTPVSNLQFSEPTPPSIFYGPNHGTKSNTAINIDLASEFSALRKRDGSEPIFKPSNKNGQTVPSVGRAVSVPPVATRNRKSKIAVVATADNTVSEKKKQKAVLENIGNATQFTEGVVGEANSWISTSSEFRYKKGASQRIVASIIRDFNGGGGVDKSEIRDIEKQRGNTRKPTTQNLRLKKSRTVDFAALSPFGGGQVVTKNVVTKIQREENTSNGLWDEDSQVISAVVSTAALQFRSGEKGNGPLQEIPGNTSSPDQKTKVGSVQVSTLLYTDKTLEASLHKIPAEPNNPPVPESIRTKTSAAFSELNTSTGKPTRPGEVLQEAQTTAVTSTHTQDHVFTTSLLRTQDSQSPWVSTQRQLSAAKRGFISVLDTPISKESSPVSVALSRLQKGPAIARNPQHNNDYAERSHTLHFPPSSPSHILMPETPPPVGGAPRNYSLPANECSGPGIVLDMSPSASITNRHRQAQSDYATAAGPSAGNGADVTFSPPIAVVRDGKTEHCTNSRGNTGGAEFSPFKIFNTPTKSQFGNFMQEFSPLRYSPDASSATKELTSRSATQSQSGTVAIRLYDEDETPKNAGSQQPNKQLVRPSTCLGLSRASNISLFNSSSGASQPRSSPPPPSPLTRRSSLPFQPSSTTPQPSLPQCPLSPTQSRCPPTPLFQRTSSSQFGQAGQQSPGAKLARDMLDLMGGGVWDIDDELNKIRSEGSEGSKVLASSKPVPSAARSRRLGKGKRISSGSKRLGQWK